MPSEQALQKLKTHLNFESYPMSSSYPQDNAEKDFRLMAKAIKSKLDTKGKMETTVKVQEKQLWYQSITNKLKTILIGDQEIRDVDEVDGRTEEILQPIVKLYFLWK